MHAGAYELPLLYMALTDGPFRRREDTGVAKIDAGDNDGCFLGLDVRLVYSIFRIEGLRALFSQLPRETGCYRVGPGLEPGLPGGWLACL